VWRTLVDDFKDIGRDLWKNKPLLITILIAIVAVAYILIKNSQAQLSAATTTDSTMPAGATTPTSGGGTYVEESYSNYSPTTTTTNPIATVTTAVATAASAATGHAPGTTFVNPASGVKHYVATGTQTLRQIASQFNAGTWNGIYSIPDNQTILGKMNASHAAVYVPKAGTVITLPPNTTIGF
jgi:hypothetical protein